MATAVTDAPAGSPMSAPLAVRPRGVAVSLVALIGTPQCGAAPHCAAVTAAAATTGTRV
jgi:hypothetical protein